MGEKNHTLEELKQKIIDYLYDLNHYEEFDVELIKVLFQKKD